MSVLGGLRIVALSISSQEQTQYCRLSLFLKDPFLRVFVM